MRHDPVPSPLTRADYAERSFDGAHFRHIATWQDHQRVERIRHQFRNAYREVRHAR